MKSCSLLLLVGCLALIVPRSRAATVTVTAATDVLDAPSLASITALNNSPGSDGKISLREAIIAANNTAGADTILFSAALNGTPITLTRTGDDNLASIGDLDINDSVTITGNGAANTIIQGASNAAFAGSIGDKVIGINQDGTHNGLTVTISGVTIRYGRNSIVASASFTHTGGGVDVFLTGTGNAIAFNNCVISDNQCVNGYGGGVNIDSSAGGPSTPLGTVTFSNCTISNNRSQQTGGGLNMFADNHNVVLNNCTISGNTTDPGAVATGANGGGINLRHTNGGTLTGASPVLSNNTSKGPGGGLCVAAAGVNNVTFTGTVQASGNVSQSHPSGSSGTGGGIFKDTASSMALPIVSITGNHADLGTAPLGGGIHFLAGTLTARSGSIALNTAGSGNTVGSGAGVAVVGGTLDLKFITVLSNTAALDGGGVWVGDNGGVTVANATISGNAAKQNGGGLFFKAPVGTVNATLANVTVANNQADSDNNGSGTGGGIHRAGGTVNLNNTILAGNLHGPVAPDDGAGTLVANFSLIETITGISLSSSANNVLNQPARLGPLASNGGATLTHALLGGSPAFDAGSAALIPADALDLDSDANTIEPLPYDQRGAGFARLKDAGDADTTDEVDIGAFEAHPAVEDVVDRTINEDGSTSFVFNFGDADLAISSVTATSSNTALVPNANLGLSGSGASRTLAITPLADKFGAATITVSVTGTENGTTLTSSDTFVLTVNPIADPPSVTTATTPEDTLSSSGLVITRNLADGAEVTHYKITGISNGTLFKNDGTSAIINGNFITAAEGAAGLKFLPAANLNTPAGNGFGFDVQAALGATETGISTVVHAAITVTEVNDAPAAGNDPLSSVAEDSGVRLIAIASLLGNDSRGPANESSQTLSVTLLDTLVGGAAVINGANIEFTPALNYNGPASFNYTVQDNGTTSGGPDPKTASAAVGFTILPVNDQPSGDAQSVSVDEDGSIGITLSGSDGDPEVVQTLTFAITQSPSHGSVTGFSAATGQFTYAPAANYNGPDTIQFTVTDDGTAGPVASLTSPAATVSITVNPVNDNPVANTDALVRQKNAAAKIRVSEVLANDTDPDSDTLTVTGVTSPSAQGGTVTLDGAWLIYEPLAGFNSADSFTYSISDGHGGTASGLVNVTVAGDSAEQTLNIISATPSGADVIVRVAGIAGRGYRLETTASLTPPITWTPHPTGVQTAAANGVVQFTDPAPPAPRYYRAIED